MILLVAAALRLPELALNPFHHDEGVNGFFTTNLVRDGTYTYDPANYHGPTLYYFALVSEILFGLTTEAMRLVPVLFGLLLVGAGLPAAALPRVRWPSLTAAALLARLAGRGLRLALLHPRDAAGGASRSRWSSPSSFYLDRREPKYLLAAAGRRGPAVRDQGDRDHHRRRAADRGRDRPLLLGLATPAPRRAPGRRRGAPGASAKSVWIDGVEYRPAHERPAAPAAPDALALARPGIPAEHVAGAAVVFLVDLRPALLVVLHELPEGPGRLAGDLHDLDPDTARRRRSSRSPSTSSG